MAPVTPASDRLGRLLDRGRLVKIDGLREPEHAVAAVMAGADCIGFIFAPARRQVTAEVARRCIEAARSASPYGEVVAVGVFVDADPADIERIVQESEIDAVQLHGAETPAYLQGLTMPAIKALRPRPGESAGTVGEAIARYRSAVAPPAGFLIDGYSAGTAGGAGARADWELAAAVSAENRVLLGGGLDPENVGAAIRLVRPIGVDVSSGVEIDGAKDSARIEAFIRAARTAFLD